MFANSRKSWSACWSPKTRRRSGVPQSRTVSRHTGSRHHANPSAANRNHRIPDLSQEEEQSMPKQHTITLIPGDGIGPEVTNAVVRILEGAAAATGASFQWESYAVGAEAFERFKEYIPRELY